MVALWWMHGNWWMCLHKELPLHLPYRASLRSQLSCTQHTSHGGQLGLQLRLYPPNTEWPWTSGSASLDLFPLLQLEYISHLICLWRFLAMGFAFINIDNKAWHYLWPQQLIRACCWKQSCYEKSHQTPGQLPTPAFNKTWQSSFFLLPCRSLGMCRIWEGLIERRECFSMLWSGLSQLKGSQSLSCFFGYW